jgi:hypothetical protein
MERQEAESEDGDVQPEVIHELQEPSHKKLKTIHEPIEAVRTIHPESAINDFLARDEDQHEIEEDVAEPEIKTSSVEEDVHEIEEDVAEPEIEEDVVDVQPEVIHDDPLVEDIPLPAEPEQTLEGAALDSALPDELLVSSNPSTAAHSIDDRRQTTKQRILRLYEERIRDLAVTREKCAQLTTDAMANLELKRDTTLAKIATCEDMSSLFKILDAECAETHESGCWVTSAQAMFNHSSARCAEELSSYLARFDAMLAEEYHECEV